MRKITEILRLKFGVGLSMRAVALSLNVSYGTVANYIKRAEAAGLDWPLPPDIDERSLGRLLFPSTGATAQLGLHRSRLPVDLSGVEITHRNQATAVAGIPRAQSG